MNLRTKIRIFISKFKGELTKNDAEQLTKIIELPQSDNYTMSCGAIVATTKRKTDEDLIRAVVKCVRCCAGNNCRGIATTVDGIRMMDCSQMQTVVKVIVDWNHKQKEKLKYERKTPNGG